MDARRSRREEAGGRGHVEGLGPQLRRTPVAGGWERDQEGAERPLRRLACPVLEDVGMAAVEHNAKDNRMRASSRTRRASAATAAAGCSSCIQGVGEMLKDCGSVLTVRQIEEGEGAHHARRAAPRHRFEGFFWPSFESSNR